MRMLAFGGRLGDLEGRNCGVGEYRKRWRDGAERAVKTDKARADGPSDARAGEGFCFKRDDWRMRTVRLLP